jgi:putative transposase
MSRPLRIEWPGGLYHVTSRGDRREPIVEDDVDRRAWVQVLQVTCDRFNWRVHAWCLMTNHYHVLLETPDGNLSSGMRHLNGVWSQQFNRRHGCVGHVFQGRFKSILVQRQGYLLELARYVVLNPVRAGMVADAAAYAWSSHQAMLAAAHGSVLPEDHWFQAEWLLAQFAPTRAQAVSLYVDFVRAGVGLPSIWLQLQNEVFLGTDEFVLQMQARLRSDQALQEVPLLQRCPPGLPFPYRQRRPLRGKAKALACASGHWRRAAIAAHFSVRMFTAGTAVAQASKRRVASGPVVVHEHPQSQGVIQ